AWRLAPERPYRSAHVHPRPRSAAAAAHRRPGQVLRAQLSEQRAVVRVEKPGRHCTLQDLGRPGHRLAGVPPGGAMDRFAIAAANRLVGNPESAGALEALLEGPALVALEGCLVAVGGGDFQPRVNGVEAPGWTAFWLAPGDRLSFAGRRSGARAYVACAGGLAGDRWLGSVATYQLVGRGGLEGRPLRAGDELALAAEPAHPAVVGGRLPGRGGCGARRPTAGGAAAAGPAPAVPRNLGYRRSGRVVDLARPAGRHRVSTADFEQYADYTEWYVWAKRNLSIESSVCHAAAAAASGVIASGGTREQAIEAARRSFSSGAHALPDPADGRSRTCAEWFVWARRVLGGVREQQHAAAAAALRTLDQGQGANLAMANARVAAGMGAPEGPPAPPTGPSPAMPYAPVGVPT